MDEKAMAERLCRVGVLRLASVMECGLGRSSRTCWDGKMDTNPLIQKKKKSFVLFSMSSLCDPVSSFIF